MALSVSAEEDRAAMAEALEAVVDLAAPHMDRVARVELAQLVEGLKAAQPQAAGVARRDVQ
jgi:hypothetical protein